MFKLQKHLYFTLNMQNKEYKSQAWCSTPHSWHVYFFYQQSLKNLVKQFTFHYVSSGILPFLRIIIKTLLHY